MPLPFLLILIGIVVAILVHRDLGVAAIAVGFVLLVWQAYNSPR